MAGFMGKDPQGVMILAFPPVGAGRLRIAGIITSPPRTTTSHARWLRRGGWRLVVVTRARTLSTTWLEPTTAARSAASFDIAQPPKPGRTQPLLAARCAAPQNGGCAAGASVRPAPARLAADTDRRCGAG